MTTQKKYSLITFAICLVLTITLLGCKKGMAITKDDALEVALDYSGFSQEEIQNPTVTEQENGNKGFLVTFGTPSGDFECVISPKGILQAQYYSDTRYGKDENNEEDETDQADGTDRENSSQSNDAEASNGSKPDSKPTDEDDPKAEDNNEKNSQAAPKSESNKGDTENKSDNDHNNQPNRTPEEEAALNLALQNVGAEEGDVENISIHPSGSNIEVRFKYGESTNIVTVNPATNSVVSTIFE